MSKNGKLLPDVDLNSFEIKINFVNMAVLEKNHKIEITYQHSYNNLNENARLITVAKDSRQYD